MDAAQYILCFVARYVNISCRKRTITTIVGYVRFKRTRRMSSAFETHISYEIDGAYAKCNFLQDLMS